jgi:hypothetical protein
MMDNYFSDCEDPELVDLELEVPPDEFGMLPAEEMLSEVGVDFSEFEELGGLQEEFETAFLEEASLGGELGFGANGDDFPMLEEIEPLQLNEAGPLSLEMMIEAMKKHPGLKITFSF